MKNTINKRSRRLKDLMFHSMSVVQTLYISVKRRKRTGLLKFDELFYASNKCDGFQVK